MEKTTAEKIHELFQKNLYTYHLWWQPKEPFHDPRCRIAPDELNQSVCALAEALSAEDAQITGNLGLSVLHQLVWHNYYEAAELLLKKGADPNVRGVAGKTATYSDTYLGVTPVMLACYMGNYEMVKLLVENGADTSLCDDRGRNAFHYISCIYFEDMINNITGQFESVWQRPDILPLLKGDINAKDCDGYTPFLTLMCNSWSRLSQVLAQPLLDCGALAVPTDNDGNTALHLAAAHNQISAALLLLKNGADVNQKNKNGATPLYLSAREENFEISYMLLEMGADCNLANHDGETPAALIEKGYHAGLKKRAATGRKLSLEESFDIIEHAFNNCGTDDNDRLRFALYFSEKLIGEIDEDDDEEVSYLIRLLRCALEADGEYGILDSFASAGFDFTMPICHNSRILTIRDYCLERVGTLGTGIIEKLIDTGVDMESAFVKGKTPANIIAGQQESDSVTSKREHIFAKAAGYLSCESMEELDSEGMSALHEAAKNNHVEMMRVMLQKGADIDLTADSPQEIGTTPLHLACTYGYPQMVELLMESDADDSMKNALGETPAHCVVQDKLGFKKIRDDARIQILEALSDVDTPRNDGKTPIILLQSLVQGSNAIAKVTPLLIEKGADVDYADDDGNTALLAHTYRSCDKTVIKELIRAGADVNEKNYAGDTALYYALCEGDCEVARLLIKKGADYNIANNKGETPVQIAVEKGYETVLELMTDIDDDALSGGGDYHAMRGESLYDEDKEDDYDDDDEEEDDDDDPHNMTEFEKYKMIFSSSYGEENATKLAEYMLRIAQFNEAGITDDNRDEYAKTMAEYQELLQALNGMQ